MARTSKLSELIITCFPPRAVIFADADVDDAVHKKFGSVSTFQQLLTPFAARLDNNANIQIVDLNSAYVNLPNFALDLVTPETFRAESAGGNAVESMQTFRRRLNALVTDHFEKAAAADRDISSANAVQDHEKAVNSCFEVFAVDFIRNLPLYELQYIRCCLAAIYIVSSQTSDALTRLISLSSEDLFKSQNSSSIKWFSSSIYKFFVLLHDAGNPLGIKREAADAIFQQMKSTFGGANVHLCVINTTNSSSSNLHAIAKEIPTPINLFEDGQLSTISGNIVPLSSTPQQTNNFLSQLSTQNFDSTTSSAKSKQLSTADADALKILLRNFVRDGLVPYAERQIRAYHQNISQSRRTLVTRSIFSGATKLFGAATSSTASPLSTDFLNAKTRTSTNSTPISIVPFADDSVHAQTRRCADLSFLFRQYDLAAQMYHSLRRDLSKQQQQIGGAASATTANTWIHYASASEMCALSSYLSKPPESYAANVTMSANAAEEALPFLSQFKEALTQYSNFYADDRLVTKCGIFYAQVLLELDQFESAANVYVKLANEKNEPSLLGALMLEQASICFNRQLMHRKYAFFIVLAGFRFAKAGLRRPALQCFKRALAAYSAVGASPAAASPSHSSAAPTQMNWHRGWHLIAERVHYLMARQCMQFNDFIAALQHLRAVVEIYKGQLKHVGPENDASSSSSKAAKTMHNLILSEYGVCQARMLEAENLAETLSNSSSLLIVHDQNVQVFFFPYSCDNNAFRPVEDSGGGGNIWNVPEENAAVRISTEKSVMEQFALAHQQHSTKPRPAAAAKSGTVFYCGAATENKAEPQPFCGDPVIIAVHFSNPFAVAVELSDLTLSYTFSEQKLHSKSSTETDESDQPPNVFTLQPVDANITDGNLPALTGSVFTDTRAIILRPYAEQYAVLFRVTPRVSGYVNIVGVRYSLRAAAAQTSSAPVLTQTAAGAQPELSLHSTDSALPSSSVSLASAASSTATFSVIEMPPPPPPPVEVSPTTIQHPLQQFSSLLPQNLLSHVESGMKKIASTNLLNYATSSSPSISTTRDTDSVNSASLLGSLQDESFFSGGSSLANGPTVSSAADTLSLQSNNSARYSSAHQLIECTHFFTTRGRRLNRTAQQKQSHVPLYDVDNRLHWHIQQPSESGRLSISLVESSSTTTTPLFSGLRVPFRLKISNESDAPIRTADFVCNLVCMNRDAVIFPLAAHTDVLYCATTTTPKVTTGAACDRQNQKSKVLSLLHVSPSGQLLSNAVSSEETFLQPKESIEVPILIKMRAIEKISPDANLSVDNAAKLDSSSYEVLVADAMNNSDNSRWFSRSSLPGESTEDFASSGTAENVDKIFNDKLQFMLVYSNSTQPPAHSNEFGSHHHRPRSQHHHHLTECFKILQHRPLIECQVMCMPFKSANEKSPPPGSWLLYIKIGLVRKSGFAIRLKHFSLFDYGAKSTGHHHHHTVAAASSRQIRDRLSAYQLISLQDEQLMKAMQLVSYPKVAYVALLAVPNFTTEPNKSTTLFFPSTKLISDLTVSTAHQQHQQQQQLTRSPYAKARAGKRPSRTAVKRQASGAVVGAPSAEKPLLSLHFRLVWQLVSEEDNNATSLAESELFSENWAEKANMNEISVGESVVLVNEANRWFSF